MTMATVFTKAKSRVVITPIGGRNWQLVEPLHWELDEVGSGRWLTVPEGTITDLASVPRFLWWVLAPSGQPQVLAAVLHDYLYRCPDARPDGYETKRQADKLFRDAMKAIGTPWLRRWAMWFAVRLAITAGEF